MIPEIVFVHCDVGEVGAFGLPVVSLSAVSRLGSTAMLLLLCQPLPKRLLRGRAFPEHVYRSPTVVENMRMYLDQDIQGVFMWL